MWVVVRLIARGARIGKTHDPWTLGVVEAMVVEWLSEVGGDGGASGGGGASGRWWLSEVGGDGRGEWWWAGRWVEWLRGRGEWWWEGRVVVGGEVGGVVERRWGGGLRGDGVVGGEWRWVCEAGGLYLWVSVVLGGMNDKKPEPA